MSYSERDNLVILTPAETIKRLSAESDIDDLYEQWAATLTKSQGYAPSNHQRIQYWRNLFIDQVWRRWPS